MGNHSTLLLGGLSRYFCLILSVSVAVLMRLGLGCSRFGFFFCQKSLYRRDTTVVSTKNPRIQDFPCGVRNRMQAKILFRQLRFSLFSSARYFYICLRRFLSEDF